VIRGAGPGAGVLLALAALLASAGCTDPNLSVTSPAMAAHQESPNVGFYRMVFDEYQGLSQAAMQRAAILLARRRVDPAVPLTEDGFVALLSSRYGFVVPARVANWPAGEPAPVFRRPIGIVSGTMRRTLPPVEMELANLGCATCHSAVLYDAAGNATRDVWVGLPSTSIDLGRYVDDLYEALKQAAARPDETLAAIKQAFPGVSGTELGTLRRFFFPRLADRMRALGATIGALTPYSNGSPGLTNGVATLKLFLGVIDDRHRDPTQVAFAETPDLGGMRLQTSILCDGVYAPPGWPHTGPLPAGLTPAQQAEALSGPVSIVTIGTLGVSPAVAADNGARMRDAVGWMISGYQPPPFPGRVDRGLAAAGAGLFEKNCARCHGSFAETPAGPRLVRYPSKLVPYDVIDTDPQRARATAGDPNALFGATALRGHVDARATGGYIAPPLTALWATAPYLHNGSVPTLWHLMHPDARPARFQVGGHRLDYARVGIDGEVAADGTFRYRPGYQPWMAPEIYDTATPGRSSAGHLEPFDELSEDDKRALLEFLKRV
jgi:mono/diheme cytochrome c family protein